MQIELSRRREIDDLLLHLRGLVLVREILRQRGASVGEISEHSAEIDRLRDRLASVMRDMSSNGAVA
ncbi:MAG: hypothetical protein WBB74_03240 [Gaiellaceae bacterium]